MKRQIIHIDQEKCNGCGACAAACHEGAIAMIGGKATLMRDDYCDGMGDCLPHCPTGAITFEQREAAPYNEAAVQAARQHKAAHTPGCPGSAPKAMHVCPGSMAKALHPAEAGESAPTTAPSQLRQWPVQPVQPQVNPVMPNPIFTQSFSTGMDTPVAAQPAAPAEEEDDGDYFDDLLSILNKRS